MGWPYRLHYPGFIYHIINRGNNRQAIFLEEEDFRRYLSLLYHYKKKYNYKIFAFCLMTNHVHLLIQVNQASVSRIMQSLTIGHTKHYHFKYCCCGHLWQGRFKSPIVSGDEYLLEAMRYIEQNPLRARMVERIEDYPWSSYKMNVSRKNFKMIDRRDNPIWEKLGADDRERIKNYRNKLAEGIVDDKIKVIHKSTQGVSHYFSQRFQEQMAQLLPKKRTRGRPRKYEINREVIAV